ncbi:hypothetical protein IG631_01225 [Alternaria alternata]|nr:hypothetical protein IG631_01225 [Alternaria alternata]
MAGDSRLSGDSGSAFCPHVFGRGCHVAGSRVLRCDPERFSSVLTPAYSPNSRHLFCHHRADFSP